MDAKYGLWQWEWRKNQQLLIIKCQEQYATQYSITGWAVGVEEKCGNKKKVESTLNNKFCEGSKTSMIWVLRVKRGKK